MCMFVLNYQAMSLLPLSAVTISAPELATMKTYVRDYLANGFIRHSKSAAGAPVMFVKRPDGKLRLVVD